MSLFACWQNAPWDHGRWSNFSARELACKCRAYCDGEYWHDPVFLDALQMARNQFGAPLQINSGHRCALHNAAVGRAPLSLHKTIAVDISTRGFDNEQRLNLLRACRAAGFQGFGFYGAWLHVDMGRARQWFVGYGRRIWTPVLSQV